MLFALLLCLVDFTLYQNDTHIMSPSLQVSTTRLAIRNIPTSWDEQKLRAVFIAGVKERATKEKPQVKQVQ